MEGHLIIAFVDTANLIESELNGGLELGLDKVVPSNHVECANWGMMADLFSINGATINKSLVCLSPYGIEWFRHLSVKQNDSNRASNSRL